MKCIVLSASRYDFEDEKGKRVQGIKVNYIEGKPEQEVDRRGSFPLSITATPETWSDLRDLPGLYECEFKQRPGRNNRPELKLTNVQFVTALDLGYTTPPHA